MNKKKEAGLYPGCAERAAPAASHGFCDAENENPGAKITGSAPAGVVRTLRAKLADASSAEFMTSSSESKSSRTAKAASPEPVASSYEAALGELERLVSQLDAGQLPLDQLLTHYQRGAQLLAYCREKLDAVENQIRVLEANELKPWDAS